MWACLCGGNQTKASELSVGVAITCIQAGQAAISRSCAAIEHEQGNKERARDSMLTAGNHEIEQQEDANYTTFASVRARWKVSATEMPKTMFMACKA